MRRFLHSVLGVDLGTGYIRCGESLGHVHEVHGRRHTQIRTARPTKTMKYPAQGIVFSSLALFSSSIEQCAIRDGTSSIRSQFVRFGSNAVEAGEGILHQ